MRHLVPAMLVLLLLSGCSCGERRRRAPPPRVQQTTQTQTETQSFLFNAKDFDLGTVTAMVKSNKVQGAEQLEAFVNSDNGINNVDIDEDGKIDYIRVVENRPGDAIVLDFIAVPSSGAGEETTIATLRFRHNTTTQEVTVSAAYPEYAHGYRDHYYSYHSPYRPGLGTAIFLAYMFSPTRVIYARPYVMRVGYAPRARYSSTQLSSRRTSIRSTNKVSPVKKASRPASYKASKSATKSASKFSKSKPSTSGKSFSSRKGNMKSFSKRDANKTKKKATGFGATAKKPASKTGGFGSSSAKKSGKSFGSSRGSTRSSGFGSSSAKKSGSSGWGGSSSSSKKKSSGFGSSSSSKKSFGSSRGSSRSRSRSRGGSRRR